MDQPVGVALRDVAPGSMRLGWAPGVTFTIGVQHARYPSILISDWLRWLDEAKRAPASSSVLIVRNAGFIGVSTDGTVVFVVCIGNRVELEARASYESCAGAFKRLEKFLVQLALLQGPAEE